MRMVISTLPEQTLEDFAKEHGLKMMVFEREPSMTREPRALSRYFCYFHSLEMKAGGMLTSESGNGDSIDEAIVNYVENISRKKAVYKATSPTERKEISIPVLRAYWTMEEIK